MRAFFKVTVSALIILCFFASGCSKKKKSKLFYPPAAKVQNPSPADNATYVPINVVLSWDDAEWAGSYNVYLGTDAGAVGNATETSPEFQSSAGGPAYDPPGDLNYGTMYYWRVDSVNVVGAKTGDVWSFTTIPPVSVTVTTSIGNGTEVIVDGVSYPAPHTAVWAEGSFHGIGVAATQSGGTGIEYDFVSWSDGGAREHAVSPVADAVYTADLSTGYFLDVTLITPASPSRGLVRLDYEILNDVSGVANLVFEVSFDGGVNWEPPSLAYSDAGQLVGNVVLNIPCGPVQEAHYVIWDSVTDAGFTLNTMVRFRGRPETTYQGIWSETDDFTVDNSPPVGAPVAVITADRLCIQSGEDIQFSALDSVGSVASYHWDFGDGSYSTDSEPLHTYNTGPGEFTVLLTVADGAGLSDTAALLIKIAETIVDYRPRLEPYRNYSESRGIFEQLADDYPNLMTFYTIGYSVEGREIHVVKISDNVFTDEDEPVVHFDAQHHAREIMTPEVIIDICEQLLTSYGSIQEVTDWIDNYEIYLIPCVNPDSVVAVFDNNWNIRKNARGVDLNRNYPADWGNPDGSSDNSSWSTYHGPFPASEPEVQTVMAQAFGTRPAAAITFHTYSNIVLYPYSSPGLSQTSQENYILEFSNSIAMNMIRDVGGPYDCAQTLWYNASGVTFDWFYRDIGTFCALVEVGNDFDYTAWAFHPIYADSHDAQVEGVRGGVMELFRYMGYGAICGHVVDAGTGEPLEATVSVSTFSFPNGEIRMSEPDFGSFYWLWGDGDYSVTFTLEGYAEQSHDITVAGVPYVLDVALVKNGGGNHRPTAELKVSMTKVEVGTTVFLDGTYSTDEDGDFLNFSWNFGDDQTSAEPAVWHTFDRTGTHRVVLEVDDSYGGVHRTWKLVHVMPVLEKPHVSIQLVGGSPSGNVSVTYSMKVPVPADCNVAIEYTLDGIIWHPATIVGADAGLINGNVLENIWTVDTPTTHDFTWDSMADLGPGRRQVVLKVTPYIADTLYGDPAISNMFTVDN
ncbi:MAG: PKD domain-containing protein [Planctomycetota bacterium]|nr:MAG: PKD domain-containing protein [Planctomycetota bacterium]